MRHICCIDESGDFGRLPSADSPVQPVLAVVGLIAPESATARLDAEFSALKKKLNPGRAPLEVKGKNLREALRSSRPRRRNLALSHLGAALGMLEDAGARVAGRVCVKPIGGKFDGKGEYVASVLSVATNFQRVLEAGKSKGTIVCDGHRDFARREVGRRFLERKSRPSGDAFPNVPAPPVFVDSREHSGVQLADWICSAIVAPLAAAACFGGRMPNSKHVHDNYLLLAGREERLWERLARMLHPFADDNGARQPGLLVAPNHFRPRLFPKPRAAAEGR